MIEHNYESLKKEVESKLTSGVWINAQILDVGFDQSSGTIKVFTLNNDTNEIYIDYHLLYIVNDVYVDKIISNYIEKSSL